MSRVKQMERRLEGVFNGAQAEVLAVVIGDAYNELVKTSDFDELKSIVRDLAQAQGRTELRMEELAQAQTRTEQRVDTLSMRMEELAQAQVRTERAVEKLALGLDELRADFGNLRSELGGISRTMGYALENEAYRSLPALLEQRHGVRVTDRFVRTEIGGEEINFLAHGVTAEGAAVILVGESKARLDERRGARRSEEKVLETLARKVAAVQAEHAGARIVPLLVTHYPRPAFLAGAQAQGVIVVQSFEW